MARTPKQLALADGTIKRIHVNQHILRANRTQGKDDPPLTVQTSAGSFTARTVHFARGKTVYRPEQPLGCGAVIWIETTDPIAWEETKHEPPDHPATTCP